MLSSIFYKEWIKIGKISLLLTAVGLLIIAGIHLTVRHDLLMKDAEIFWSEILYQKYVYFSIFKFLPLITGLLIGLAQFIPETIDKRIKLSLHLPINEERDRSKDGRHRHRSPAADLYPALCRYIWLEPRVFPRRDREQDGREHPSLVLLRTGSLFPGRLRNTGAHLEIPDPVHYHRRRFHFALL